MRPIVSLNSADYDELLSGNDRPTFLLRYSQWYRHFGLRIAEDDNLLPDHLVCQLEFLAWLAQLEYRTEAGPELQRGYRKAQQDFIERELLPLLPLLQRALGHEAQASETANYFLWLSGVVELMAVETLALLCEQAPPAPHAETIEAVNLWG